MKLINKTDANLNIALIAKNKAKSDAQKALMGRVLFMMDNMPTIEAIPKDQYEARLKADMLEMLEDLRLDFQEAELAGELDNKELIYADEADDLIQQKINSLKEDTNQ